jgi:hypothetical protein
LARLAAFVCFTPAKRVASNNGILEKRRQAVKDGTTTTHWPERCESTENMAQFYPHLCPNGCPPKGVVAPVAACDVDWCLVDGTALSR